MRAVLLTVAMSAALTAALAPLATFPALVPTFTAAWGLSNTEAGWISGIYYVGYMVAVPVLVSATDRHDARFVFFVGTGLGALATLAFAWLVDGFWSALLWRAVAGIGLAGTYMPGVKALTDRSPGDPARSVAAYMACYSFGSGLSFLLAGWVEAAHGWRAAFAAAGLGPLAALMIAMAVLRPKAPAARNEHGLIAGFRRVLRDRRIVGYVLGYGTHNFEALAMRAWVVTLLAFAAAGPGATEIGWTPTEIATALTILGLPGTLLGNEFTLRVGRNRGIVIVMLVSAAVAVLVGLAAGGPYWLLVVLVLVHGLLIPADSTALVAGAVDASPRELQGASLALQSSSGFGASFFGPLMVGIVLDLFGGAASAAAWGYAFFAMAAVACLGPLTIRMTR